ncbi:Uncharacterized protein BC141101_05851 [Bacillus toyonensis]|uniref:hypothetical protein n=1 Tax=Bacillus cereus group TaxID=86661 RepID=UPI0001A095EF|nr:MULTISPECIES: hypothetical protein [Bacillus cereus group]COF07951.1 Uncharacterised protein [Streptococcus pneumoniae]EEL08590.1 hypothetical protein bcere0015_52430 [Bacillus cereus BDRD-Cer4]EJQ37496.1 hypothetical protein IEI_05901 [Bacillus wiedmannii]MCU4734322.1 hypothetical protein [Bacillus cereus]COQ25616.1 Uncharacterised protein [Streptococcus pneumoniae]
MKKLYALMVVTLLLLSIANSSPSKVDTKQYYAKVENLENQKQIYRMMVDPGGGG